MSDQPDTTEAPQPSVEDLAAADLRAAMTGEPVEEAPPEPAAVEVPTEVPQSLEAKLRARAQERQQAQQAEALQAELAELRAFRASRSQAADPNALIREALGRVAAGDLDFLREHGIDPRATLKALTSRALNPVQADIDRLREEMKQGTGQQYLTVEQVQQMMEADRARARAEESFVSSVSAEKYPMLSKMDRADLIRLGNEISDDLQREGVVWENEAEAFADIAQVLEERRVREYRSITGEDPPHLRKPATRSTNASSDRAATPTAEAVITNDLAAAGVPRPAETDEERDQAAMEILRNALAS